MDSRSSTSARAPFGRRLRAPPARRSDRRRAAWSAASKIASSDCALRDGRDGCGAARRPAESSASRGARTGRRRRSATARVRGRRPARRPPARGQDFGVGGLAVGAAEILEARLQKFAAPRRRGSGTPGRDRRRRRRARPAPRRDRLADGNGEFRPQAIRAGGVGGEIQAAADVLAGEVEKDGGRLQDRRLGAGIARATRWAMRPGSPRSPLSAMVLNVRCVAMPVSI